MLVQALDHFVVPVNDIVVAEDFYVQVFGGKILKRNGLNVKTQVLGAHTFMDIAGKRIGVYLQKRRARPSHYAARHADLFVYHNQAWHRRSYGYIAAVEDCFRRAAKEQPSVRHDDTVFCRPGGQ